MDKRNATNTQATTTASGFRARRGAHATAGTHVGLLAASGLLVLSLCSCAGGTNGAGSPQDQASSTQAAEAAKSEQADETSAAGKIRASLNISEDYRDSFVHGDKPAEYQKYIVLHDTEVDADPSAIVSSWDNAGSGTAAHFVVGKDGTIVQCVPLEKITHHAGFGDTGHNEKFGVEDDSRDDKAGTTSIGSDYADYGMNSYSVGIEMVHVSADEDYPEAQLDAVDGLIAYIDAHFGFESEIIDHKAWRTTNSDTTPEFSDYLANYQKSRTHTA